MIGHTTKWIALSHANVITHTKIRSDTRVKHSIVFKQFESFDNSDTLTKVIYNFNAKCFLVLFVGFKKQS